MLKKSFPRQKSSFNNHHYSWRTLLILPCLFLFGLWIGARILPLLLPTTPVLTGNSTVEYSSELNLGQSNMGERLIRFVLNCGGIFVMPLTEADIVDAAATNNIDNTQTTENTLLIIQKNSKDSTVTKPNSGEPQIIIYCTHSSEEYAGQKRVAGQAGGVMEVAATLAATLEELGHTVFLDETLHETSYNDSYSHALNRLTQLHEQYPSAEVYVDVHRDSSIAGISTQLSTSSGSYAKMMLVIGSDEKLEHPNWQQNYAFAQAVDQAADQLMPGIMREPRVYSGRYNQHIGNKAILVEMGSTDNSVEEAKRSAKILAQAISNCL